MKVFLDLGAHNGCSYELWKRYYPDYIVYSFEPNPALYQKLKHVNPNSYCKAAWVYDGSIEFGRKSAFTKNSGSSNGPLKETPCVDIASFIIRNCYEAEDIQLKFDTEGSEYAIVEHLNKFGLLGLINKVYGELHSYKYGNFMFKDDAELLLTLQKNNLKLYHWDALDSSKLSNIVIDKKRLLTSTYPKRIKQGYNIDLNEAKKYFDQLGVK